MKSVKYTIVENTSIFEFEKEVNRLLSCGYKLQGGVCLSTIESGYVYREKYVQAMVRELDI